MTKEMLRLKYNIKSLGIKKPEPGKAANTKVEKICEKATYKCDI